MNILLDTDIGGDCDDMGALAIIDSAVKSGACSFSGIAVSTKNPYAPACADAVNRYYGIDVSVAQTEIAPPEEDPSAFEITYGKHIALKFKSDYVPSGAKKPLNAVEFYRKALALAKEKVTIITIGSLTNLAALINSAPDGVSPLTGLELIKKSVSAFYVMGCFFPTEQTPEVWFGDYNMRAECNIKVDIPAAKVFFENVVVPVYVSHYLIGLNIRTGAKLMKSDVYNPVAEAYLVHSNGDRESWDPVTALCAIYGQNVTGGVFSSHKADVTIDDEGVSRYVENQNSLVNILECSDYKQAEKIIDRAMCGERD